MTVTDPNSVGRASSISMGESNTSVRTTPRTDFGTMVRNGMGVGAGAVAGAAGVAAPFIPGGAVVSSAVNGAAGAISSTGAIGNYGNGGALNLPGTGPTLGSPTNAQGGSTQGMMDQAKEMQEMQMSFSMQYLTLQEKMQNENRQYSTLSNVMKTKHDTAKSTINNVR